MLDLGQERNYVGICASPILYRGKELLPNLDVRLASDKQSLELRHQFLEVLDQKSAEVLVDLEELGLLALLVHQDLAVDSLDEVVAPDFSEIALGEIDDQLQLVASYCRCFDVQTSEKLEETIELRVVEQRRASGEILIGETCDIVG